MIYYTETIVSRLVIVSIPTIFACVQPIRAEQEAWSHLPACMKRGLLLFEHHKFIHGLVILEVQVKYTISL